MERNKAKAVIESILFAMGETVEISKLAELIEKSVKETNVILSEMEEEYKSDIRGIDLMYLEDKVQLCTKGEFYEYLIKIARAPKKHVLTDTLLETLSIVAYKQPVTRGMIEKVRGVNSDGCVMRLYERGLIDEAGRLDAPGRPVQPAGGHL